MIDLLHPDEEELLCKAIEILADLVDDLEAKEEQHASKVIRGAIHYINQAMDIEY